MLGNPVTNCDGLSYNGEGKVLDLDTKVNLFYWHGMVSRRDYDNWNNNGCNTQNPPSLLTCYTLYSTIASEIGVLDQPLEESLTKSRSVRTQPESAINPDMLYFSYCIGNGTLDFVTAINPGCFSLDEQVSAYLNDPAVQAAIHAKVIFHFLLAI